MAKLNNNGLKKLITYLEQTAPGVSKLITIRENKLYFKDLGVCAIVEDILGGDVTQPQAQTPDDTQQMSGLQKKQMSHNNNLVGRAAQEKLEQQDANQMVAKAAPSLDQRYEKAGVVDANNQKLSKILGDMSVQIRQGVNRI